MGALPTPTRLGLSFQTVCGAELRLVPPLVFLGSVRLALNGMCLSFAWSSAVKTISSPLLRNVRDVGGSVHCVEAAGFHGRQDLRPDLPAHTHVRFYHNLLMQSKAENAKGHTLRTAFN